MPAVVDKPGDPNEAAKLPDETAELRHVEAQRLDQPASSRDIAKRDPARLPVPVGDPSLRNQVDGLKQQIRRYRNIGAAFCGLLVVLLVIIIVLVTARPPSTEALPRGNSSPTTAGTANSWSSSPRPPEVSSSNAPTMTTGPTTAPTSPASEDASAGPPKYIADLNTTGANWAQGTWSLGGTPYAHSLAWTFPCNDGTQYIEVGLPTGYQHFSATVGVDDAAPSDNTGETVGFEVYVDANNDGTPNPSELVGSRGGIWKSPGRIDAPLNGATSLILLIRTPQDCVTGPVVWGSPEVY
jgi:NPCBM/NEW2 domain